MAEARKRPEYRKTVLKELEALLDFHCWGRPVPWSGVPDDAVIYKGKLIYGVKHDAKEEGRQKDKARCTVQGCIRILKNGKVVLEQYYKTKGEYWAPTSSLAGLRLVIAVAAILGVPVVTIDLDSGYVQTNSIIGVYLLIAREVVEMMGQDWVIAYERAALEDPEGKVLFPLWKNLYGKSDSGFSFISDFQHSLIAEANFKPLPHCHGTLVRHETHERVPEEPGRPSIMANYVDDCGAALSGGMADVLWTLLAKRWRFSKPYPMCRFLGVKLSYPLLLEGKGDEVGETEFADAVVREPAGSERLRLLDLHQGEYLAVVISRYEKASGTTVRTNVNLPTKEPDPFEEESPNEAGTLVRSTVSGIMYGARGTRLDLAKPTGLCATRVVSWSDSCTKFLEALLAFIRGSLQTKLRFDARGEERDVREWRPDLSVDADYRPGRITTGVFMAVTPIRSRGTLNKFLTLDYSSTGQKYAKLSAAESEIVGAVHGTRVGIRYADSWRVICDPEGRAPAEDQRGLTVGEIPEYAVIRQREDNTACRITMTRGWSQKLSHVPTVYGVSVLWASERIREGRVELYEEPTAEMIADPLTKLVKPEVLFRRGILHA